MGNQTPQLRRRVMFVQRAMVWGGSVRSTYHLATGLAQTDDVWMAVYGLPTFAAALEQGGVRLVPLRDMPFESRGLVRRGARLGLRRGYPTLMWVPKLLTDTLPVALRLARVLRRTRPDIVHTCENIGLNRAEALGALLAGTPLVAHVRGVANLSPIDLWIARRARHVVAVSEAAAKPFREAGLRADRVSVVNNCVPLPVLPDHHARAAGRRALGLDDATCWIVTTGRLIPRKGNREAIDAVADLRRSGLDVGLILVGEGPEEPLLRTSVKSHGMEDAVVFAGWQDDPAPYVLAGDILLLAAQLPEGFPRSVLEGMACGLPVVATDVGGTSEVFEDGRSGTLVRGLGSAPLRDALEPLVRFPERRRAMAQAARSEAEQRFAVDVHVAAVARVYERVLTRGDS